MKTSLKKLVAGASILALVSMNALTYVNGANAVPTFSIATNGAGVADDVVTVSLPDTLVTNNTTDAMTVVITNSLGAVVDATTLTVTNGANATSVASSTKVVVTKTGAGNATFTFTPGVAGNFGVSVVGTAGVGSAVVYVGNSNEVKVSAIVTPTLSMNLSSNAIDLGVLDTTGKASSIKLDVTTNANGGATTTMKSNGLIDTTNNKEIGANLVSATTVATTGNDSYKYAVSNGAVANIAALNAVNTAAGAGSDALGTVAATDMPSTADTTGVTVANLNKPGTTTKHVAIGSVIAADTEAGNYSDTLTFTVTGSF